MNTRKFLLWDKSALMYLNEEERKQLDAKHTMLYPPILLAEIAKQGLDKPKVLFNFKNTVNVYHWVQRAKIDLIKGVPSGHYNVGTKIPTTVISEYPKEERKDLEEQAKALMKDMEAETATLKKHFSILRKNTSTFCELAMNHENVPDDKLLRKVNQTLRQSGQNPSPNEAASLIAGGRKSIAKVRETFDNNREHFEMLFRVNTLEKAARWIEQVIYTDTESILDFLCKADVIPLSADEREEIFNRFRREGKPHINKFAPYARVTSQLYLTIFLYLVENKDNSSPKEVLRDFEYLYYATDANVIFISGDNWHRKYIEEIPMLINIQKNFRFLPHRKKDEQGFKKVLNSIGIRAYFYEL